MLRSTNTKQDQNKTSCWAKGDLWELLPSNLKLEESIQWPVVRADGRKVKCLIHWPRLRALTVYVWVWRWNKVFLDVPLWDRKMLILLSTGREDIWMNEQMNEKMNERMNIVVWKITFTTLTALTIHPYLQFSPSPSYMLHYITHDSHFNDCLMYLASHLTSRLRTLSHSSLCPHHLALPGTWSYKQRVARWVNQPISLFPLKGLKKSFCG